MPPVGGGTGLAPARRQGKGPRRGTGRCPGVLAVGQPTQPVPGEMVAVDLRHDQKREPPAWQQRARRHARRILDERLARAGIDAEEYRRLRDMISSDSPGANVSSGRAL